MAKFDTYEFKIPSWAVCPLKYGDYSGLNDEDIAAIERFVSDLPRDKSGSCGHFSWGDESYYSHDNDVNNLGSGVLDCEYLVLAE